MNHETQRPAFGQKVTAGTLYDARSERFLPASLLKQDLSSSPILITDIQKPDVKIGHDDTYEKQFEAMNISPGLGASILAELITLKGSSVYLNERPRGRALHAALHYTYSTVAETLNFSHAGFTDCLAIKEIDNRNATHIVAKVEWGIRSIIAARQYLNPTSKVAQAKTSFQSDFVTFLSAVETLQRPKQYNSTQYKPTSAQMSLEITAFSDILDNGGILMGDFQEAFEFLQMMPLHLNAEGNGKGLPIMYSLLPIDMLAMVLPALKLSIGKFVSPAADGLSSFIRLFGEFQSCQRTLDDLQRNVLANQAYLSPSLRQSIADRRRKRDIAEQTIKTQLAHTLQAVRGGADPKNLGQLLAKCHQEEWSPKHLADIGTSFRKTVEFISRAISKGAVYVGYNGSRLDQILPKNEWNESYVLFFTPSAIADDPSWPATQDLLFELLRTREPQQVVAICDCEAMLKPLDKVCIAQYQGGQERNGNFLEYKRIMADKCFAQFQKSTLETDNVQRPIQRRHVTIPCPGPKCTVAKIREWICPQCITPIEYGFTDEYVYCDCGRSVYTNYTFKCNSDLHGSKFVPYDPVQLLRLLRGLSQTNYLNILILGETGVGKSTFINALVNYLEFESLDEAMAAEKLNYVIPCSFSTQIMNREDPSKPIEERRIKIGARDDEQDGSTGDSATQQTTVYPVTFTKGDSTLTVRLIDTPGMGDTRGVDFDRKNMADILSTLSGYEELHGILVLLKSNAARLTISFSYCIKELLTHLHHNAAKNMAFGFTNTRISNYTPGDTYGPLTRLLHEQPNLGLELSTPTTYCFDSESFRYLAAFKEGTTMTNKVDFDRSWNHSRQESLRLINWFKANPPHQVKSTLSLNGARQIIIQLTKPMAEISQSINTNIAMTEDKVKELRDTRLSGDQLRNQLHVQMVQINAVPLDQPRTVCGNASCITVKDDGKGQNQKITVYVKPCHPVCSVRGIQADQVAPPGLTKCSAFGGHETCRQCGHHWQEHLHFLWELNEETVTVVDPAIQTRLQSHANDITLRETALRQHEQRIVEYKQERDIIRNAAASFGVFLRKNSMAPYNDALIAYLDYLIKEEQIKVQAGGNNKRLLSLTEERHKHQEAIEVITQQLNANVRTDWDPSQPGAVDRIVQQLFGLKHFGKSLMNMKQGIVAAHEATYREMPYTVRGKNYGNLSPRVIAPMSSRGNLGQGLARGSMRPASRPTQNIVSSLPSIPDKQWLMSKFRNKVGF